MASLRPDAIRELVTQHGGIQEVRTHRAESFDRRTGGGRRGWANTIVCRDGWTRTLTPAEEVALRALPEELKAVEHVIEDGS